MADMKIYTSTAPLSKDLKDALSKEKGRDEFLEFLNGRAKGDTKAFQLHTASKVIEVTAEPAEDVFELP
jgi:hypothetical protein